MLFLINLKQSILTAAFGPLSFHSAEIMKKVTKCLAGRS